MFLTLAKRHQDALSAESLLDEMAHLKAQLRSGLDQAEAAGNPQAFLGFSREYRATLEAYFTISERMAEKAQGPGSLTQKGIQDLCHIVGIALCRLFWAQGGSRPRASAPPEPVNSRASRVNEHCLHFCPPV